MQYYQPERFWGRFARPQCAADSGCEPRIALALIDIAVALFALDLLSPQNITVVAAEPLLMAAGGWVLSEAWSHRLLAAIAAGFATQLVVGDEESITVVILFVVTALIGLTAFELSDSVNRRRLFVDYLEDQLRTPVALMRGYASMAKDGDVPAELALARVVRSADLLGQMLEGALHEGAQLTGANFRKPALPLNLHLHNSAQHYEVVWHGIGRQTDTVRPGGERGDRTKARDQDPVAHRAAS